MKAPSPLKNIRNFYPDEASLPILEKVAARYAVSVTRAVHDTIKTANDPIGRQYLPQAEELLTTPDEMADPIGDAAHSPVPGIVHRYPDRVLLTPVHVCAVYCRFCFRREMVGPGRKTLSAAELEGALDYIRGNQAVWEVILTGGDPLILSPRRLKALLEALEAIDHVKVLRIHTRLPVADPEKITAALCEALRTTKALYVAIHVNHEQEITAQAEAAFTALRRADCVLISQTVLLRTVNDTPEALEALFRRLVSLRVKPYYLHHPDLAPGTGRFRLSIEEGQAIFGPLRGRLSGLAQPTYILDIPGGYGKVPVGPVYLQASGDEATVTDPAGRSHAYPPKKA